MMLFALRSWPTGRNLVSGGVYPRRGWLVLLLFVGDRHTVTVPLPVRAQVAA